ncbi:MAG TPA: RNA-splicing ligase RtcB [Deltaproteobacteria bacterium]|nr:MAG: RNA-splicing ligase RtcB [Deltaproteobacteria bacterium GWC2_65_14]HBO69976.1 RNA-splicing ligase RtcB [Deltaproteobacteria bacterium]
MRFQDIPLRKRSETMWEIPQMSGMRVPGLVFASERMMTEIVKDEAIRQVINVAHLPGIQRYSIGMPDIHWGYGFPIGGVAAMDVEEGVVSPGGVGYDINCGVRLLRSDLTAGSLAGRLPELVAALHREVPSGVGSTGFVRLAEKDVEKVLREGSRWAASRGFATEEDVAFTESGGCFPGADPDAVSGVAKRRGRDQLGTLGSGNHFIEIDEIAEIYDEKAGRAFGLFRGQAVVLIHSGSRGLGYQVCDDFLVTMAEYMRRNRIELPDRQLACAHVRSPEGERYLEALAAAANYAFANRQLLAHQAREVFLKVLRMGPSDLGMRLVYDCGHNNAKFERHEVDGRRRELLVHRKGATRCFPPGARDLPDAYRETGQPVLIPGDMGTASYVLAGTEGAMELSFGSTCHGAGRRMSRKQARSSVGGRSVVREMEKRGVLVASASPKTLAEEIPEAYKDVSEVVDVVHNAGIARKVARLRPLAVVKG